MSEYTPGPWEYLPPPSGRHDKDDDGPHPVVLGPNGENPICVMEGDWEGEWADARLIAAAPDLLEACDRLVHHFNRDAVDAAIAAIAKATGETT